MSTQGQQQQRYYTFRGKIGSVSMDDSVWDHLKEAVSTAAKSSIEPP